MASLYPYGIGNPLTQPSRLPRAAYYDLATRQILWDTSGKYVRAMHPIDQAVAFIVGNPKGTFKSLPDMGIDYTVIDGLPTSRWQSTLDAEMRRALKMYLDRSDITVGPLTLAPIDASATWRLSWTADYTNNRIPSASAPGAITQLSGRY